MSEGAALDGGGSGLYAAAIACSAARQLWDAGAHAAPVELWRSPEDAHALAAASAPSPSRRANPNTAGGTRQCPPRIHKGGTLMRGQRTSPLSNPKAKPSASTQRTDALHEVGDADARRRARQVVRGGGLELHSQPGAVGGCAGGGGAGHGMAGGERRQEAGARAEPCSWAPPPACQPRLPSCPLHKAASAPCTTRLSGRRASDALCAMARMPSPPAARNSCQNGEARQASSLAPVGRGERNVGLSKSKMDGSRVGCTAAAPLPAPGACTAGAAVLRCRAGAAPPLPARPAPGGWRAGAPVARHHCSLQ